MFATDTLLPITGGPIIAYAVVATATTVGGATLAGLAKIRGRRK